MSARSRRWVTAPRLAPLAGLLIGALGGAVYWLGTLLWPTSVAVMLSMAAVALISARTHAGPSARAAAEMSGPPWASPWLVLVFAVLVKYNALMALSAASLPFTFPANLALGLIMIAGQASSRSLVIPILAAPAKRASNAELGISMAVGFAPAALIGMPGLFGLLAAIAARIALVAYAGGSRRSISPAEVDVTQQLTELCFYLGALAAWPYT